MGRSCFAPYSIVDEVSLPSSWIAFQSLTSQHIFPIPLYHSTEYNSIGTIGKENTDVEGITMPLDTKEMFNEKRCRIFNYVMENPGRHFSEIKRELGFPKRTLGYHLDKMMNEGILISQSKGIFKFYYPVGYDVKPERLTPTQQKVVDALREKSMTTREMATIMDKSMPTTKYHLDKLREMGFVDRRIVGTGYEWYVE